MVTKYQLTNRPTKFLLNSNIGRNSLGIQNFSISIFHFFLCVHIFSPPEDLIIHFASSRCNSCLFSMIEDNNCIVVLILNHTHAEISGFGLTRSITGWLSAPSQHQLWWSVPIFAYLYLCRYGEQVRPNKDGSEGREEDRIAERDLIAGCLLQIVFRCIASCLQVVYRSFAIRDQKQYDMVYDMIWYGMVYYISTFPVILSRFHLIFGWTEGWTDRLTDRRTSRLTDPD